MPTVNVVWDKQRGSMNYDCFRCLYEWTDQPRYIEEFNYYKNGYKGSCYACEEIGIINQQMGDKITHLQKEIEELKKELGEE